MKIKLTGAEKLLARIEKVKNEKGLFRLATREAAKAVAKQVKEDLPKLTGATIKGVKVKSVKGKGKLGASVVVGTPGTETYRAWFLEHGTEDRTNKSHAFRGMVKAGHYVAKALEKLRSQCVSIIKDIVKAKIWQ